MKRISKVHLPGVFRSDPTLCMIRAQRWSHGELVSTSPAVVSRGDFDRLPEHKKCGRCVAVLKAS